MRSRRLFVVALVLAVIVVAGFIIFGIVIPGSEQSKTSGTLPPFTSQFSDIKTKAKTAAPTSTTGALNEGDAVKLVSFVQRSGEAKLLQGFEFTSCTEQRGSTATPKSR